MKIEWLVADVTTVKSLDRAEVAIVGVIMVGRVFGQFRSFLWPGSHNRVVGNRCNSYWIPWQSGTCCFGGDFGWACFWPIQDIFVVAEPLCDVGTSS